MPTRNGRVLFALIAILAVLTARADDTSGAPHADHIIEAQPLTWLKIGDYTSLDRYYSDLQARYESGSANEQTLFDGFHELSDNSAANERYFDAWVNAFPNSYAAHLARGTYFYRMAHFVRGANYFAATPPDQIAAMTQYLDQAQPELLASVKMTGKPYLSALYLLDVTTLHGSAEEHRHWYEEGIRMDPADTLIRIRYMTTLRPRWGGSYEAMEEFLTACARLHLDPRLLAQLEILIHTDKAEDAMRVNEANSTPESTQEVFNEWQKVLELAAPAGEAPATEALAAYTRVAFDLHRRAEADQGLAQLAKRNVEDGWSLEKIAWVLIQEHRDAEALPVVQKAAALNEPWSQFVLGETLYRGCPELNMPPNQTAGLAWIERSAHQCHADAVRFLTSHGYSGGCDSLEGPFDALIARTSNWWSPGVGQGVGGAAILGLTLVLIRRRRKPPDR